ncbi:DUF2076 domain-containing protein [Pseudonocardia sp. TRM90224]|uniref:DUF2076 domain-containing protein n=1 Tax=Pseudonocardia sp. TRM90224 TaxID=2812678 RepID=UPI001E3BF639|nr:DUF2076 family protein [Pseudonocardia sp. TRM90224]
MDANERQLILGLADRLRAAQPVAKDPGAAELITSQIATQPDGVYLLVQAVLVQEDALRTAQARIAELSAPAPAQQGVASGGLLGSLFGKGREAAPAPAQANSWTGNQPAPAAGTGSGGGFLKTAAAAAAGVAGGGLLLHGLTSAFSGPQHSPAESREPDSFAWDSGADDDW